MLQQQGSVARLAQHRGVLGHLSHLRLWKKVVHSEGLKLPSGVGMAETLAGRDAPV